MFKMFRILVENKADTKILKTITLQPVASVTDDEQCFV